jgi:hypothetical protein
MTKAIPRTTTMTTTADRITMPVLPMLTLRCVRGATTRLRQPAGRGVV